MSTPINTIFLHVTKACNLSCTYCYFSAKHPMPDEMTALEFGSLWPEIVALRPRSLVFTGGEPLIRRDIVDLLREFRNADLQHDVKSCLNTNGHLVSITLAKKLVGLVDEVRVSLDSVSCSNDSLRGDGNFVAALKALRVFRDGGFEPKVLVTVTSKNIGELEALLDFLYQLGYMRVNLNPFRPIGRGADHRDLMIDIDQVKDVLRRSWIKRGWQEEYLPRDTVIDAIPHCGVGKYINIMPNGDVFPCHVLTDEKFACGNLRKTSLSEICDDSGLLARLRGLDFGELTRQDSALAPLIQSHRCLGPVYSETKNSRAWSTEPLVQIAVVDLGNR